jgi:two-component system, response regulator PdtaR
VIGQPLAQTKTSPGWNSKQWPRIIYVAKVMQVPKFVKEKPFLLVVEDEELIRMDAVDMVRDLGFEPIEAANADHALSLLESRSDIAAVFTDIQMPGSMDGLRLVAVISNRWPPIALLVTSGQKRPPPSALPQGARFIPKPYMRHELGHHLSALTGFGSD